MTSITQTIPSFVAGISQQPDELKLPGQVNNLVNAIPDITEQLVKRPGSKFISSLSGATSNGAWFSYFRDEAEGAYIGQVDSSGAVRMWTSGGTACSVTNSVSSYLASADPENQLKFLTVNDYTFVTNTTKTANMSGSLSPTRSGLSGYTYNAFVELKQLAPGRQYSLDVSTPGGGVQELDAGKGKATSISLDPITWPTIQRGSGSYYGIDPSLQYMGTQIFKVSDGDGRHLVFRLTVSGQVAISQQSNTTVDGDDYVGVYDRKVEILYGGQGWATGQTVSVTLEGITHTIRINTISPVKGRCNIGSFRPAPTSFEAGQELSAESILSQYDAVGTLGANRAFTMNGAGVSVEAYPIGNGLFLRSNSQFVVSTSEPDLWKIMQHEVNDPTGLPTQCKHNYLVKVISSKETNQDDYYLKFVGTGNSDGPGYWEETVAPGIKYSWDINTLPVTIVRTGVNQFTVDTFKIGGANAWKSRTVGDESTNPTLSFDGKKISQTFFHRNRLGFLSEGNVILSAAGDLGNFWNDSALIIGANDPIDIAASSTTPTIFRDAIETNTGLVIFADNQQFLLHTDSDTLTPETGKLSNISTYNYNPSSPPISLGTTIGFTDNAGKYTRFFEMFDIRREGEPRIIEQTKVVSKLLPNNIAKISNSRENSTIFFVAKGTNTLYGYRYFNAGNERVQSAWFKWQTAFNIYHTFFIDDTLYLVTSDYSLLRIDLNDNSSASNRSELTGDDFFGDSTTYELYLDSWKELTIGNTYNEATDLTAVSKSSASLAGSGDVVIVTDPNGYYATMDSQDGSNYYFRGNYAGATVYIGYLFDMIVEFPRLFVKRQAGQSQTTADVTASLTVHRMRLMLGAVGYYKSELKRKGKGSYITTYDSRLADGIDADEVPFISEYLQNIPVYERNVNAKLILSSKHPSPATVYSLTWEGDYNSKHYRRV